MKRAGVILVLGAALFPALTEAYVQTKKNERCIYWPTRNIGWKLFVDESGQSAPGLETDEVEAVLKSSWQSWEDAPCSDISFSYQGRTLTHASVSHPDDRTKNENILMFRTRNCKDVCGEDDAGERDGGVDCADRENCWEEHSSVLAMTRIHYHPTAGFLVDADIEFNAVPNILFTTTNLPGCEAGQTEDCAPSCNGVRSEGCIGIDLQNVATHEVGHAIGLDHPPRTDGGQEHLTTMYETTKPGELLKRTLSEDDINGVCAIYPPGRYAQLCDNQAPIRIVPRPTQYGDSCGCRSATLPAGLALLGLAGLRRRKALLLSHSAASGGQDRRRKQKFHRQNL